MSIHHSEAGQQGQALAELNPDNALARWRCALVEIYALGRGVRVATQRDELLGGQGPFELEANGKFFGFNPFHAAQTHGFVASVKGQIRTIFHPLDAIDEENSSKLGCDFSHCQSQKTTILSLPQGMGKTTLAQALAKKLGCVAIVDDWSTDYVLTPGALHLTCDDVLEGGAA